MLLICPLLGGPSTIIVWTTKEEWSEGGVEHVGAAGFGWAQAKPACSTRPFAVTPDELGDAWQDGRVYLSMEVRLNGQWFGNPHGGEMAFGFHDLVAHAARTRHLVAGTIIGSGTVSYADYAHVGSACVSERRAIEMIASGTPVTPFLKFGDRVQIEVPGSPLGALDQKVIRAPEADQPCWTHVRSQKMCVSPHSKLGGIGGGICYLIVNSLTLFQFCRSGKYIPPPLPTLTTLAGGFVA